MTDRKAMLSSLTSQNLLRFSIYVKSDNRQGVFRHLPTNSPAKGTTRALEGPGMDVVGVKHLLANCTSPEGPLQ
jgi:hypothetical protein